MAHQMYDPSIYSDPTGPGPTHLQRPYHLDDGDAKLLPQHGPGRDAAIKPDEREDVAGFELQACLVGGRDGEVEPAGWLAGWWVGWSGCGLWGFVGGSESWR